MKAYVFPGQGAQFTGMGKDLYETSALAKELFEKANEILGFRIKFILFDFRDFASGIQNFGALNCTPQAFPLTFLQSSL